MATLRVETSIKDNRKRGNIVSLNALTKDVTGKANLKQFVEDFRERHIIVAKEVLREEQQKGFTKEPRKRIDNKFDTVETKVLPFGKIEYFAKITALEGLLEAYDIIEKRVIKGATGNLSNSNYVIVNGKLAAKSRQQFKAYLVANSTKIVDGTLIKFVNVAPYARKLELQGYRANNRGRTQYTKRTSKSKLTGNITSAPNGAYWLSFRAIRRSAKTKQLAEFVRFQFIHGGALSGIIPNDSFRRSYSPNGANRASAGRAYSYPAIVLEVTDKGLATANGGNAGQVFTEN